MVTFGCTAGDLGRCPKLPWEIHAYLVVRLSRGISRQGYTPAGLLCLNVCQMNSWITCRYSGKSWVCSDLFNQRADQLFYAYLRLEKIKTRSGQEDCKCFQPLSFWHLAFFPTFPLMVVRFYVSCPTSASSSSSSSAFSSASSAGPQLQALDRSVFRRTWTTSSRSERSPPDLNCKR